MVDVGILTLLCKVVTIKVSLRGINVASCEFSKHQKDLCLPLCHLESDLVNLLLVSLNLLVKSLKLFLAHFNTLVQVGVGSL